MRSSVSGRTIEYFECSQFTLAKAIAARGSSSVPSDSAIPEIGHCDHVAIHKSDTSEQEQTSRTNEDLSLDFKTQSIQ
jgi:hypothetical protein